jgi:hypothetical protein
LVPASSRPRPRRSWPAIISAWPWTTSASRCCRRTGPILIHCLAGVSRSTAAALIALALVADGREAEAARRLREAAPHASPNRRIVMLADRLLGRRGRLVLARETMGPAEPVLPVPLVELPLEL